MDEALKTLLESLKKTNLTLSKIKTIIKGAK